MDSDAAARSLAWLETPLGKKTQESTLDPTPESPGALNLFVATFNSSPPQPKRIALVRRLDDASSSSEIVAELLLSSMRRAARFTSLFGTDAETVASIESQLPKAPQLRQQMREISLVTIHYQVNSLSDDELDAYVAFTESPAGRWHAQTVARSLLATNDAMFSDLEARVGRIAARYNLATTGRRLEA